MSVAVKIAYVRGAFHGDMLDFNACANGSMHLTKLAATNDVLEMQLKEILNSNATEFAKMEQTELFGM